MKIRIRRPDDWHVHLRDADWLSITVPATARHFARAVVMPNLDSPILIAQDAKAYRARILKHVPEGTSFSPLMTCYLSESTTSKTLEEGAKQNVFFAAKLYPANATTNSKRGIQDILKRKDLWRCMEELGLPLLIHGEVTEKNVDIFDREVEFIERTLKPLMDQYPKLKIVFEHITTKEAVTLVKQAQGRIGATITPHHLLLNRNSLFDKGLRPHHYCLPILKRESHQMALRQAATSGLPYFFLGTDSAPHAIRDKESDCGCAGIFNAPTAMKAYFKVFSEEGQLARLEAFSSEFGAKFYGLELNPDFIEIETEPEVFQEIIKLPGGDHIKVFLP